MKRNKRVLSIVIIMAMLVQGLALMPVQALGNANVNGNNLDFESGLTGWTPSGNVQLATEGSKQGTGSVLLPAGSSISRTITDIPQGSYTLKLWAKGTAGNNSAAFTIKDTGGPDSVALVDPHLVTPNTWVQIGHRNVLVYNGQMTLQINAGNQSLYIDHIEIQLDAEDDNTILNWGFEDDLNEWTSQGTVDVITEGIDTGAKAVRLSAGSEIVQKVAVQPNTKYGLTVRAKVDKEDKFRTESVYSASGKMGELVHRTELGNRVNLGARTAAGQDIKVLRQAPSGTEDYSLVTITFITGENDTEIEVYANTVFDQAYRDSITVYKNDDETSLADNWNGNGADKAYVDNFNLFAIQDENQIKGADVSFLPAIEDNDGKYFANGVQQDSLRIFSNHGVNSITSMIMVHAGNVMHGWETAPLPIVTGKNEDGSDFYYRMIDGYFSKEDSLILARRATALNMSFSPSFHFSDGWMSQAKAHMPLEWIESSYDGKLSNPDLEHMKTVVYNYVYDFLKPFADEGLDVVSVKQGNEQNSGILWPVGRGGSAAGHKELVTAAIEATNDVMSGVPSSIHSNKGSDTGIANSLFGPMVNDGIPLQGTSHSLYGGHSSARTLIMADFLRNDSRYRYLDFINVETGFSFTNYLATFETESSGMGQVYYKRSPNGQYNWLLDYMQAPLDATNPHGQTRGFYYWAAEWIPTPGAGGAQGGTGGVNVRIMFNNGDVNIKEMGSSKPGKAGDMMDSMYAYLMRSVPKAKNAELQTPIRDYGASFAITPAEPTGITLLESTMNLTVGATPKRVKPTVQPYDSVLTDSVVTYASSNPQVAVVSHNGIVTAKSAGTATVTATVKGGHSASVAVTVSNPILPSSLNVTDITGGNRAINEGDIVTLKIFDNKSVAASLGGLPTDPSVTFRSDNPDIVSFFGDTWETEDGVMRQMTGTNSRVKLIANKGGTANITATSSANPSQELRFAVNVTSVPVTGLTLDKQELALSYGRTAKLTATVAPSNSSRYKVLWTSSDETVAKVDETGRVTAIGVGEAQIRATSDDSSAIFAEITATVLPVQVEGIRMLYDEVVVQRGSTKKVLAEVLPADANNKTVTWTSGDETIVTVDQDGNVMGINDGTAVITATTVPGINGIPYTASTTVIVQQEPIPVTGVELGIKEYYFKSDYFSEAASEDLAPAVRLTAKPVPALATNDRLIWTSDTPEVATVDQFGNVAAVSSGTAKISVRTDDGGYTDTAVIYVPSVSESFENRAAGLAWGTVNGASTAMGATIAGTENDQYVALGASGTGGRGTRKLLAKPLVNDEIVVDVDFNFGAPTNSNGVYFTLMDSSLNRYLSVQKASGGEIVFNTGGQPIANAALASATPVGSGFTENNAWYHIRAILNMKAQEITLTVTSKQNPTLTATHKVPFHSGTAYKKDLAGIEFQATRSGGTLNWNGMLDNLNLYAAGPVPLRINANVNGIKLIPVAGTLGTSAQLTAAIYPESASQEVVWAAQGEGASAISVSPSGLVQAKQTYGTLAEVPYTQTVVRVSSKQNPNLYKEIPVTITNEISADEHFFILDEGGAILYRAGENPEPIELATSDVKKLTARVTGGDGDTDLAGVQWSSDNSDVLTVTPNAANPRIVDLQALQPGEASVTLTITLYGTPLYQKSARLSFEVKGEEKLVPKLNQAIMEAESAKAYPDDYYTAASLQNFNAKLQAAKQYSEAGEPAADKRQEVLDSIAALEAAVDGLAKSSHIPATNIAVEQLSYPVPVGNKIRLTASLTPSYANDIIRWSSSDESIATVDANGRLTALGKGVVQVTATTGSGATTSANIVIGNDLTSWYDKTGVTITGEGNGANYPAINPFVNARTNDTAGPAWSTGSNTKMGSITIALGKPASLKSIDLAFWQTMKYKVEVSEDGSTWTTAIDKSEQFSSAASFSESFSEGTTASYIKLTTIGVSTARDWVGVTLVRVNGQYLVEQDYGVSVAQGIENGTVSATPTRAVAGETVSVSAVPDAGYELQQISVFINNADLTPVVVVTEGRFVMPNSNVIVSAVFSKIAVEPTEDTEAPTWPESSTLTSSNVDTSSVTLAWGVATDNVAVTGYKMTWSAGGQEQLLEVEKDVTSTMISGLQAGTAYTFKLTAIDAAGNRSVEREITVTLAEQDYAITIAQEIENGTVSSTPTRAVAGETVSVGAVPATGYELQQIRVVMDNADLTPIDVDTEGRFVMPNGNVIVSAVFSKIAVEPEPEPTEDTEAPTWPASSTLTSSNVGTSSVTLAWGAATDNVAVTGYKVTWSTGGQDQLLEVGKDVRSTTISGLQSETSYTFKIAAVDEAGNRSAERELTVITSSSYSPPYVPPVDPVKPTEPELPNTPEEPSEPVGPEVPNGPEQPVAQFKDVSEEHWAGAAIKRAATLGIVNGYSDNTFKPNAATTRAQFMTMLAKAFKWQGEQPELAFSDNGEIGAWAKDAIGQGMERGIITGYSDGSFRPNQEITRTEMIVMLARAMNVAQSGNEMTEFADDTDIPAWGKGAIEALRGLGIVTGRGNNSFAPNNAATRAEALVLILRVLDLNEQDAAL
ncbi:Ig-like domain-containing protein [Paenibacillus luteus]|uniref:Ig-like domain-containing protein n=1 Tax=Paenibacillus luteus TaxID=2545753 RepID=UPI00114486C9|nr:Ig-like domain-containing protein [Paenibacillus luteus]